MNFSFLVQQEQPETIHHCWNYDLDNICTPVDVNQLRQLLIETDYCQSETQFIVQGFTQGFSLCYQGPVQRRDTAKNIPFMVGNKKEMWDKIIKEVRLGHYAGPFVEVPFQYFIHP